METTEGSFTSHCSKGIERRCLIGVTVALLAAGCATLPKVDQDLFAAAKADNATEAERLLAAGAKTNGKNDRYYDGLPPLAWAAGWGSIKTVELLLARGADVNAANKYGTTSLHVAAFRVQPAVAEVLIRHGADVNARSEIGWTPLHKAMERLGGAPATPKPPEGDIVKVSRIVQLLLDSGAEVNARDIKGISPIHLAAGTGEKRLVQLLLDSGADVNATSANGGRPLLLAAGRDVGEVAALLIEHGADVNARDKNGYTPLMAAAGYGNPDVARVLLEHGADVNARDDEGFTAVMPACRSLLFEYTFQASTPGAQDIRRKVLARVGARSIAADRKLLRRAKRDFSSVAILLLEHGADPNAGAGDFLPLQTAALVGDTALAEAAIAHGAMINRMSRDGTESPLHAAIAESHGNVAELLIAKGADVNARNMSELTPLHFLAVFMHDRKLAELLIRHGADVNAKDKVGHTPLADAIRARNNEVAEVLKQQGAR